MRSSLADATEKTGTDGTSLFTADSLTRYQAFLSFLLSSGNLELYVKKREYRFLPTYDERNLVGGDKKNHYLPLKNPYFPFMIQQEDAPIWSTKNSCKIRKGEKQGYLWTLSWESSHGLSPAGLHRQLSNPLLPPRTDDLRNAVYAFIFQGLDRYLFLEPYDNIRYLDILEVAALNSIDPELD